MADRREDFVRNALSVRHSVHPDLSDSSQDRHQRQGNSDFPTFPTYPSYPNNSGRHLSNFTHPYVSDESPQRGFPSPSQPSERTNPDPHSVTGNVQIFNGNLQISNANSQGFNNLQNLSGSPESHELSDLRYANPYRRDSTTDQIQNPFIENLFTQNDYQRQNDFTQPLVPEDQSPFASDYDRWNAAKAEDGVPARLRENEKNRVILENRRSKYHFTKIPWFSLIVTSAQIIVFIVELVKMGILTGSPVQTQPYFNPMIGPSTYLLVNMGARYVPCMHEIDSITLDTSIAFPCPNSTTTDTNVCSLSELCGMGGIPIVDGVFVPSQKFRVFVPIFLHAGFLHIFFNLLLQVIMGIPVERRIGFMKYSIIYIGSGVAGFLLGANFTPIGIASTGSSGALFGIIAANLLLFIYCGKKNTNIYFTKKYTLFIVVMVIEIIVSFVLGLLPGLDNFSHIGGFCMGMLLSVVFLHDPSFVFIDGIYTYSPNVTTIKQFLNNWNPLDRMEDKILWKFLVWTGFRVVCLTAAILYFVLLTKNLYSEDMKENILTCSWCKYINCIPVNDWCEMGEITVTTVSGSQSATSTSTPTSTAVQSLTTTTSSGSTSTVAVLNPNSKREVEFPKFHVFSEPARSLDSHDKIPSLGPNFKEGTFVLVIIMALFCVTHLKRSSHVGRLLETK